MSNSGTILIVDDDQDMTESLRLILESGNYRVLIASTPHEGLQKARQEHPDVILVDVMMPEGTEGFHFVWDLRRDPDLVLSRTPVAVLSSLHRTTPMRFYPDERDPAYGQGDYLPIQDFLDKPVSPGDLLERVRRLIFRP